MSRLGPIEGAGRVFIVGAGPGDQDLITVKGLRILRQADALLYDRLAPAGLLRECRPEALRIDVGKRAGEAALRQEAINQRLIQLAGEGRRVVRLKGGDPFIFGRGGEEVRACRRAGVAVTVVPGISSALAAPAAAGIPLTFRGVGREVAIVTARSRSGREGDRLVSREGDRLHYESLAAVDTVVILMGRARLEQLCRRLIEGGKSPQTPAASIQWATTDRQRQVFAPLNRLASEVAAAGLEAPLVTVVGEVVSLAVRPGTTHPDAGRRRLAG